MPMEMEMPDSFDTGGTFLAEPGTYHFAVMEVNEQPTAKNGTLLDGFRVDAEVLAGPQAKKQVELMFFAPKLTDKNNGEMAKKKQGRFVLATGILADAKPGEKVVVDLQKAKSRQFIATMAKGTDAQGNEKKFLELHFADIWHVDDPSATKCELNQAALSLLPKSLRRSPESFGSASGGGSGSGSSPKPSGAGASAAGSSGNGSPAAASTPAPVVDLDNL